MWGIMYLILFICIVSVVGATVPPPGTSHAGNFMACSPCFSFQGQNILVPGAPQCLGGFGNPWCFSNAFNHPFFGCGGGWPPGPNMPVKPPFPGCPGPVARHEEASSPTAAPEGPAATPAPAVTDSAAAPPVPLATTLTPAVVSPAPEAAPVGTTPAPEAAPVGTTPAPEAAPVGTTPAPDAASVVTALAPGPASVATAPIPDAGSLVTTSAPIDASTTSAVPISAEPTPAVPTPAAPALPEATVIPAGTTPIPAGVPDATSIPIAPTGEPAVPLPPISVAPTPPVGTSPDSTPPPVGNTPIVDTPSLASSVPPSTVVEPPPTMGTPAPSDSPALPSPVPTPADVTATPSVDPSTVAAPTPPIQETTPAPVPAGPVTSPAPTVEIPATSTPSAMGPPAIESSTPAPSTTPTELPPPSVEGTPSPSAPSPVPTAPIVPTEVPVSPATPTQTPVEEEASASAEVTDDKGKKSILSASGHRCLPKIPAPPCGPINSTHGEWGTCIPCEFSPFHDYPINTCHFDAQPPEIYSDYLHNQNFICGHDALYPPCDYHPCFEGPHYETKVLPPISSLNASSLNDFNITEIEKMLPPGATIVKDPAELKCVRHRIVNEVRPVIDECITNIPIIRNKIKQKEEIVTRHIPVIRNTISTREERRLVHVPILKHLTRNIVEHKTEHIPVTKARVVPVVQTIVNHVPVTRQYCRPIVESSFTTVPVVDTKIKPVIHQTVSTIPITEKRIRPVLHEKIVHVPIKETVIPECARDLMQPLPSCHFDQPDKIPLPSSEFIGHYQPEQAQYPLNVPLNLRPADNMLPINSIGYADSEAPVQKYEHELPHSCYQDTCPSHHQHHHHHNFIIPSNEQEVRYNDIPPMDGRYEQPYGNNEIIRSPHYDEREPCYENEACSAPMISRHGVVNSHPYEEASASHEYDPGYQNYQEAPYMPEHMLPDNRYVDSYADRYEDSAYPSDSYGGVPSSEGQEVPREPASAPLVHSVPFPIERESSQPACYNEHPDYCD